MAGIPAPPGRYQWDAKEGVRGDFASAELYDRVEDGTETINLASQEAYREVVVGLSGQLADGWRQAVPE